ncbi:MAG TPA: serine hydrolase domain-containing protein [Gaiellaceae bacterium]
MELAGFGAITSVLVERRGEIVLEQYETGAAETLRNTRSCTKTVLSLLVGIANLPLETEVAPGIAAGDLLTMSSALDCDDWDDASPGNEELMYPTADWAGFALALPRREERTFSYCTAGVVLLGVELERRLGEPLTEFARRELFAPLGIERFDWPRTPHGETSCAGGLALRSRDLLALGRLVLPRTDGPVPRAWLDESTSPRVRIDERLEYGYLWWIGEFAGHRSVFMSGAGGSRVHVFPELDTVVVITSENFGRRDAHDLSSALVTRILSKDARPTLRRALPDR